MPLEWQTPRHAACAVTVMLSVLAYLGSLTGELVWDDRYIVSGGAIGGGDSLLHCFTRPFLWHYCRPLVSLSFFIERRFFDGNPGGYHLTNVILHALATLTVIGLVKAAFERRWLAALGGLLFALQPVQVGSVAWMGGRTDALCVLWVALFAYTLVLAARDEPHTHALHLSLSALCFAAAVFTKEQALAALPLVPLSFACFRPRRGVRVPGAGWWASVPFVVAAASYLAFGPFFGMPRTTGVVLGAGQYLVTVGQTLCYYALLLVVPTPAAMHTTSLGPMARAGVWSAVAGYGALAACVWLFARWLRREPPAAWFMAMAVLLIAPVSNAVPLPYLIVVPYRAALPGIAVAALMARLGVWLLRAGRGPRSRVAKRAAGLLAPAACLGWYAALTTWGAVQWRSEPSIFGDFVRYDPSSAIAQYTLASSDIVAGRNASAVRHLSETLRLLFGEPAWRSGDRVAALLHTSRLAQRDVRQTQGSTADPRLWTGTVYAQLGYALFRMGQPDEARSVFLAGLAVSPADPDLIAGKGICASASGQVQEAYRALTWVASAHPDRGYVHSYLGGIYAGFRRWDLAARQYAAWVRWDPQDPNARLSLIDAQMRANDLAAAEASAREALKVAPSDLRVQQALDNVQRLQRWLPAAMGTTPPGGP